MKTLKHLSFLLALTLAGCGSTSHVYNNDTVTNQAKEFITPTNGEAAIYLYTSSTPSFHNNNLVVVGDICAGKLDNNSFLRIDIPAGKVRIGTFSRTGINNSFHTVEPNSINIFKVHAVMGYTIFPTKVAPEELAKARDRIADIPMITTGVCSISKERVAYYDSLEKGN